MCCSPWGLKESDMTEQLHSNSFSKTLKRNERNILWGKDMAILTFRGAVTSSLSSNSHDLH